MNKIITNKQLTVEFGGAVHRQQSVIIVFFTYKLVIIYYFCLK